MMGFGSTFSPDSDIPDLKGKVAFVTGGNTGLGKETIRQLAKHNASEIYMASRTQRKAKDAIDDIEREIPNARIHFLELDLNNFKSIAEAVRDFEHRSSRLDILFNNAGIMNGPYGTTAQGYEIQFGTNHMGHALLTHLLLPTLLRTAEGSGSDVRIINLSSSAHQMTYFTRGLTLATSKLEKQPTMFRYGNSKLANLLHARGLAKRYPQLTVTSVHPGFVGTELFAASGAALDKLPVLGALFGWFRGTFQTVADGARNQLWAATAPKEEVRRSCYFTPVGKKNGGSWFVSSEGQADRLWDFTQAELKKHGY